MCSTALPSVPLESKFRKVTPSCFIRFILFDCFSEVQLIADYENAFNNFSRSNCLFFSVVCFIFNSRKYGNAL